MLSYHDEHFMLKAATAVAHFSDDEKVQLDKVTIRPSTPMGHEFVLSSSQSPDDRRIVRLILILPQHDWRRNQTYEWKLDNAWMSDIENSWLHWNVESFIDSEIQVPHDHYMFACESIELHFHPIGGKVSKPMSADYPSLMLKDVEIGAHLERNASQEIIMRGRCLEATCSMEDEQQRDFPYIFTVVSSLVILLIVSFCLYWQKQKRAKRYEQLRSAEEDLKLNVVDTISYQNVLA